MAHLLVYIMYMGYIMYIDQNKNKNNLYQIFGTRVQHTQKKLKQSDLSFCKNEGIKKIKINGKGGQLDRK